MRVVAAPVGEGDAVGLRIPEHPGCLEYRRLADALRRLGVADVPAFLAAAPGGPWQIRVVDGVYIARSGKNTWGKVDADRLREIVNDWRRDPVAVVVGVVQKALDHDADALRRLVLFQIALRFSDLGPTGTAPTRLRSELTRLGIVDMEIEPLVASLLSIDRAVGTPRTVEQIVVALESGEPRRAWSLAESVARPSTDPVLESFLTALEQKHSQVKALLAEGERLESRGDLRDAAEVYLQIRAMYPGDREATARLSSCPPPAPTDVCATPVGERVRVDWRMEESRASLVHIVTRTPANDRGTGFEIGRTAAASFEDPAPPIGRDVVYAVRTEREDDGAVSELAMTAPLSFLPRVDGVKNLCAVRLGDTAMLTWEWPNGVTLADVTVTEDRGGSGTERITLDRYRRSGVRIGVGNGPCRFDVRTIVVLPGGPASGPAATVELVRRFDLRYELRYGGRRRRRTLSVTLTSDGPPEVDADFVLVVRRGEIRPNAVKQGDVLLRVGMRRLAAGRPIEQAVAGPVPPPPYCLRGFAEGPGAGSIRVLHPAPDVLLRRC